MGSTPKNVRDFYKRYLACGAALDAIDTWKAPPKCPINDDVIALFISKTTWYGKWKDTFGTVDEYSDMEAWLGGDDTRVVWENVKAKHTMSNVEAWCKNKEKEKKKRAAGKSSSSKNARK